MVGVDALSPPYEATYLGVFDGTPYVEMPRIVPNKRLPVKGFGPFPAAGTVVLVVWADSGNLWVVNADLPVGSFPAWTFTNVTTDRTVDANATSIDEIADALGTLVTELKTKGVID